MTQTRLLIELADRPSAAVFALQARRGEHGYHRTQRSVWAAIDVGAVIDQLIALGKSFHQIGANLAARLGDPRRRSRCYHGVCAWLTYEYMISFVIPARNEAENIERCVRSIFQHAPRSEPHEVIVIDNGSRDETMALARAAGARVLSSTATTVAAVRNEGVAATSGDLIIFIDADCALTSDWEQGIAPVLAKMRESPIAVAGSHPIPPPGEDAFLWKYWFVPLFQESATSHVGTAHLICRRDVFERLGGFDVNLETNEDFDFCVRAKEAGGQLFVERQLTVEHYGFPRTWGDFFRRERWHGKGSSSSFHTILRSRVALMSMVFAAAILLLIAGLATRSTIVVAVAATVAVAVLVASTVVKFRRASAAAQAAAMVIFVVYYAAHAVAIIDGIGRRLSRSA